MFDRQLSPADNIALSTNGVAMSQPTVFLDRDGTLVVDPGFIDHPDKVRLIPGASEAVKRFRKAGYKIVIASNQSGVARGFFDEEQLARINSRMMELLAADGATIDGIYYCPYLDGPDAKVDAYRKKSDLRKPAPGMLIQAAKDLDLDLSCSWMIGDAMRDIQAGDAAGCRTILIESLDATSNGSPIKPTFCVTNILEAAQVVENETLPSPAASHSDSTAVLTEIRDLLDRQHRERTYDDFSLAKLMATLVQLLTIAVAIWGILAAINGLDTLAQVRLTIAIFLQLAVITIVLFNRRN